MAVAKVAQHPARLVAAPRQRGGCSTRKAAKRLIYPWINSQIVAVAESGDFAQLVATIQIHAPQMNLVNLATALHRLARLAQGDSGAQFLLEEGGVLVNLSRHVDVALQRMRVSAGPPQCQALANITWSHASMQFVDLPLLHIVVDLALRSISGFKPFELSTIIWAFAKLGTYDPAAWECGRSLFEAGARRVAAAPEDFPFRCLVMTSWAFSTAGHHEPELFANIAPRLRSLAHGGSCRELATALCSFCAAGAREERLFAELARLAGPRLEELPPDELKGMLRSFAAVGFAPKVFLEQAAKAAKGVDAEALRMAKALLLLAKPVGDGAGESRRSRRRRPHAASGSSGGSGGGSGSETAGEAEEQHGAARPPRPDGCGGGALEPGEATCAEPRRSCPVAVGPVPAAAGVSGGTQAMEEKAKGSPAERTHAGDPTAGVGAAAEPRGRGEGGEADGRLAWNTRWASPAPLSRLVTVKNTFLHIDEEDEEDTGGSSAGSGRLRPLPPSLEIIPRDVSPNRLAAYRTDYQRFRTGSAAGARGELLKSVV